MPKFRLYSIRKHDLPDIKARIFLQDPLVAASDIGVGLTEIKVTGEPFLGAGPTSGRVAVVDYDADLDELHEPVTPLAREAGFAVGRRKPTRNFKFHQTNVWVIITRTLNLVEDAKVLGRRVPWAFSGGRLLVFPHSGYDENAHYDRESGSLHFFYFDGDDGRVYTCLSHDIITHELGHAVLDGLKPYYNEIDGPEVAGFHEYFGDALAMVSALTMEKVLLAVVGDRPRRLSARNLVSDIGLEFGTALYGRGALRTGANRQTMRKLRGTWEEHDYSEVLSGAFNDVLLEFYAAEVPRALKGLGKRKIDGQVAMRALINAARQTSRIMLRAIDYCPPAGLTYLDYARAVIRADEVAYPLDERDYRGLVTDVLKKRGVISKRDDLPEETRLCNDEFRVYDVDTVASTRTDAYVFLDANREALQIPRDANFTVSNLYRTRKLGARGYYPPREIVIEFTWSEDVDLDGGEFGDLDGERFPLWCGGTLVFDSDGNVLHYIIKHATQERRETLRSYLAYLVGEGAIGGSEEEFGLAASVRRYRISTRVVDGRIQALRNPALRHVGRKR